MSSNGWIGVDLDGTLAHYTGWKGPLHIGDPIPAMVERVKAWLSEGKTVKIFTARVATRDDFEMGEVREAIEIWSRQHIGRALPITATKDFGCICLYDDRCRQVELNTGRIIEEASA